MAADVLLRAVPFLEDVFCNLAVTWSFWDNGTTDSLDCY